jgi:hypothetical protein
MLRRPVQDLDTEFVRELPQFEFHAGKDTR